MGTKPQIKSGDQGKLDGVTPEFDFQNVEAPQPAPVKRLFLLDGMALVYRAHFALIRSPRFTSGGRCTSAVFGVANTLLDILNREQPTHVAVVFDTDEPTQRHVDFPEYKAQR